MQAVYSRKIISKDHLSKILNYINVEYLSQINKEMEVGVFNIGFLFRMFT